MVTAVCSLTKTVASKLIETRLTQVRLGTLSETNFKFSIPVVC